LLRTDDGLYLYDLMHSQTRHVEGAINDFDFYLGKGSLSPDGGRFAFTLSGPGDTYVIDITSAQATTVIDEPLEPGEDECCTTPHIPRWLDENLILASTQSLGPTGRYGDLLVNVMDGTLITSPDSEYRIEGVYFLQERTPRLVLILRKDSGEYAFAYAPDFEVRSRSELGEVDILPPGVLLVSEGGVTASSLLDINSPSFRILRPAAWNNYAANTQWLAAANEQFVTVYDLQSGEWVETLAPPGYHRFELYAYKPGTSLWSNDGQSLALEAHQQEDTVLLIATLEELPEPASGG
jgi:hypothetical protein